MKIKLSQIVTEEAKELLRQSASDNRDVAAAANEALAAQFAQVVKKAVFDEDTLGSIYNRIAVPAGADVRFPVDLVTPGNEDDFVAFTMPKQGRIPERHVESDELWVPTYKIANAIDWDIDLAKDARWDIVGRALEIFRSGVTKKLNDDGWHVILAAALATGLMIRDTAAAAGVFTPALIYRMKTTQKRRARNGDLTDVYVSSEALEDMRNWADTSIVSLGDGAKDRIFFAEGDPSLMRVGGVNVNELRELGEGTGGTPEEYQDYFVNTLGGVLGAGGDLELVIGLDLSKDDSFLMPVREELQLFPTGEVLHRQGRQGYYGWMRLGFAALDLRRTCAGSL